MAVLAALSDVALMIPARALVVHTKYWSVVVGDHATRYRDALQGGITMSSTRYRFGDAFTRADYESIASERRNPAGAMLAIELKKAAPELVCLPAVQLDDPNPTTIGLGDSFVGGFIAAIVGASQSRADPTKSEPSLARHCS